MALLVHRPDLLEAIVGATERRVELSRAERSARDIERQAGEMHPCGQAFEDAVGHLGSLNIIAECKRRSPSRGVLRRQYDPVAIAKGYERAGAAAISVLTEPGFFDGHLSHLSAVRAGVSLPLLRKDFIVDDYQLVEARASGADAVLLIVAALDLSVLRRLRERACDLGLAALVEVHDMTELHMALDAGATLIGVNNRNLRTLELDVGLSHEIARTMPAGVTMVSESGLQSADDLTELSLLGFRAFLIGERFMTAPDPGAELGRFLHRAEDHPSA
ncbi:MAG: indole-3-glycerol phosphate synthase TrpC [Vicinamibacterales bacterium]